MRRVLIVDDELPIINGLSFLFKRYFQADYSVVGTARSGREAIEKSMALAPEIILMDVQMPGISGLEVIRELSHEGGAKAFILVTAYERFDIAREALSMGVCDYLLKPVSRERLDVALRTASAYLDRVQMLNERELEFKDREQRLVPFVRTAFSSWRAKREGRFPQWHPRTLRSLERCCSCRVRRESWALPGFGLPMGMCPLPMSASVPCSNTRHWRSQAN